MGRFWQKYGVISALLILFIGPLVAAWIAYQHGNMWVNKTTNHGTLIRPLITMKNLGFIVDTPATLQQAWKGKWLLIYILNGDCDHQCENNLYKMRQIRLALGANSKRVTRMIATNSQFETPHLNQLITREYAGTQHIYVHYPLSIPLQENVLYIADPHTYVMMSYPGNADPTGIYKDLKRLVRR